MVIVQLEVQEQYLEKLESFVHSCPNEGLKITSLDKQFYDSEVQKRVLKYEEGRLKTESFGEGINEIREHLISQR